MARLYYKIILEHKNTILTYIVIFLSIFTIFGMFSDSLYGSSEQIYEQKKTNIAILDHDNSELSKAVVAHLKETSNYNDLGDDIEDIKEALFFAQIDNIIEIPKGFEQDFEAGKENVIQLQQRPDDANGVLVKQKLNSYLSSLKSYRNIDSNLSYKQASSLVTKDLKQKAQMKFVKTEENRKSDMLRTMYFNFMSYVLFSVIVMTASSAMHSIYRSEMLKRTLVSPMNSTKMNLKVVLSNVCFGLILWLVFTSVILFIRKENMFSASGALYILNSFVFTIVSISFAYMATAFVSNKKNAVNKLDMITTIVGLVSAFLGGAFLPQMFIPENILQISKFIPTFWFVKLNDSMTSMIDVTSDVLKEGLQCMGIQLLFAIAFLMIGLVVMKNNRSQDAIIDNDYE